MLNKTTFLKSIRRHGPMALSKYVNGEFIDTLTRTNTFSSSSYCIVIYTEQYIDFSVKKTIIVELKIPEI